MHGRSSEPSESDRSTLPDFSQINGSRQAHTLAIVPRRVALQRPMEPAGKSRAEDVRSLWHCRLRRPVMYRTYEWAGGQGGPRGALPSIARLTCPVALYSPPAARLDRYYSSSMARSARGQAHASRMQTHRGGRRCRRVRKFCPIANPSRSSPPRSGLPDVSPARREAAR